MLVAIIITLLIVVALAYSMQSSRRDGLIDDHGYNNRYSDAPAARRDHLG